MADLTLTQARTRVLRLLDDPTGARYNVDGLFTDIDQALQYSVTTCLQRAARAGVDRFDVEITGTTSAVDGSLAFTSSALTLVRGVSIAVGNSTYQIPEKPPLRSGFPDLAARAVTMLAVKEHTIPLTGSASQPLVNVSGAACGSWASLDEWCCQTAALYLVTMDNEKRDTLMILEDRTARDVLARPSIPASNGWPRPEYNPLAALEISWQWLPAAVGGTLYLRRRWA